MSDERLRELERRWKETGSVEDEAAFLLERVRAGELTQERLELAAGLGHGPALAVASEVERLDWSDPESGSRACRALGREDAAAWLCDCIERALGYHSDQDAARAARRILDSLRAWVKSPGEEQENALAACVSEITEQTDGLWLVPHLAVFWLEGEHEATGGRVALQAARCAAVDQRSDEAQERLWQRERLCQFLLGYVNAPARGQ